MVKWYKVHKSSEHAYIFNFVMFINHFQTPFNIDQKEMPRDYWLFDLWNVKKNSQPYSSLNDRKCNIFSIIRIENRTGIFDFRNGRMTPDMRNIAV